MRLTRTIGAPGMTMLAMARVLAACGGDDIPPPLPATPWASRLPSGGGATGMAAADPRPTVTRPLSDAAGAGAWRGEAEMFRGDLGNVRSFAAAGATVEGTDGATSTSVRLDAESPSAGWWAMTQLRVAGTLRHPMIRPGARLVFDGSTPTAGSAGSLAVTAIGCSGPRRNNTLFDRPAEQVTMNVSAGPVAGTQRIDFTATFAGAAGPQLVAGAFVYDPR
jgi:hypothetical protein